MPATRHLRHEGMTPLIIRNEVNRDIILLHDHHREYTGDLDTLTGYTDGKWCRVEVIWDGFALESHRAYLGLPSDDAAIDAAFRQIFGDKLDAFLVDACAEPSMATIWSIMGEGKRRAFDHILNALDTVPTGDDDTFDYWPNTFDMLWEFACDLDELESSTEHRTLAAALANKITDATFADQPDLRYEWDGNPGLAWKGDA